MTRLALALLFSLVPGLVAALTCLPPDAARLYQIAAEAEAAYLPVYGQFDADQLAALRIRGTGGYDEDATAFEDYPGLRFHGRALTASGFTHPFDSAVTLRLTCLGPWCTGKPVPGPMLAFFEVVSGNHILDLNVCGGMGFVGATPDDVEAVETCHTGSPCTPKDW